MTASAPAFARRFAAIDWSLFGVSLVCGLTYLLTRGLPGLTPGVVVKGLSVAPLAFIALRQLAAGDGRLLGAALLCSALGDVFLGLRGEQWFTYGLGSFLLAHLFYIALFVRNWPRRQSISGARQFAAMLLITFAVVMFVWLWPSLGAMKLPVAAYLCALTGMGVTATLTGRRSWWVASGAALFILSDSLIATGKFKAPLAGSHYVIWATYYVAQVFIALGFISEKHAPDR